MKKPDDPYWTDAAGIWFAGYVFGLLSACALAIGAGGCAAAASKPQLPGVLPVAVVSWPAPIKPDCELSDLPQVPDVFIWTQISDDEASRIYITQRQLADLVVWLKDVQQWSGLTTRCLEKLAKP